MSDPKIPATTGPSPMPLDEAIAKLQNLLGQQCALEERNRELQRELDDLKLSNSYYFEHYEFAPVTYLSLSDTGLILQHNRNATALLGIPGKDLLGKWFARLIHGDDRSRFEAIRSRLGDARQPASCELRMERHGVQFWAHLWCSSKGKVGYPEVDIVMSDINERKLAELALVASQARLRAMIEATPEAILVHRLGKILFVNRASVRMFGASSAQDLVGRLTWELIHPDYREQQAGRMNSLLQRASIEPRVEAKFLRLDGTVFDVEVQGMAIDCDGETAIHISFVPAP